MGTGASVLEVDETMSKQKQRPECPKCNKRYGMWRKKRICTHCTLQYCSKCVKKRASTKLKACQLCDTISCMPGMTKEQLRGISSGELKLYLAARDISIEGCVEKGDLVDLVISSKDCELEINYEVVRAKMEKTQSEPESPGIPVHPPCPDTPTQPEHPEEPASEDAQPEDAPRLNAANLLGLLATLLQMGEGGGMMPGMNEEDYQREQAEKRKQFEEQQKRRQAGNLDNIQDEDQLCGMKVAHLKAILDAHHVDYSMCIEKSELLEKVVRLWNEHRQDKDEEDENRLCQICSDARVNCVFLECGHLVSCLDCAEKMSDCPICRAPIVRRVRVFQN